VNFGKLSKNLDVLSNIRKAIIYDPHTWTGPRVFHFQVNGQSYVLNKIDLGDKSNAETIVFIADHYAKTKLPLYFPRSHRVALLKESPIHTREIDETLLRSRFNLVLTHREDLIEQGLPFVRADFSTCWVGFDDNTKNVTEKTKLISFLGSVQHPEKFGYVFRMTVAEILINHGKVDCFGKGINEVERKTEALTDYCFSVAMENSRENYYYTEKIIDCFFTDTIPIYWGCPGIGDVFDLRGIITFETIEELLAALDGLSFDKYYEMLPYVKANRQRCIDLGLDSFESYLLRCLKVALRYMEPSIKMLKRWQVSKPMAGIRWLMEKNFPDYPFPL